MAPQETVCAQQIEEKTQEVSQITPEPPTKSLTVAGNHDDKNRSKSPDSRTNPQDAVEVGGGGGGGGLREGPGTKPSDEPDASAAMDDEGVENNAFQTEEQEKVDVPNEGTENQAPLRQSIKNIYRESLKAPQIETTNVVYREDKVTLPAILPHKETGDRNDPQDPDFDQKLIDFDDVLPHMGEFGMYQKILFLLLAPFAFFVAFVYFTQIFITLIPEQHWCRVPALENVSVALRLELSIPKIQRMDGNFGLVYDKCRMYDVDYAKVLADKRTSPDPTWKTTTCKNGWEFNYTDIPYKTIASELGWVCENASLGSIAQAVFFFGAITGGLIFGWVADRFGRIPALVGTNVIGLIAGCATALVNSFWAFCVCRFLVGLAFDNCFTMMYILVLEYVGPKWRTFVANMSIAIYFTFASCLLPWIAIWVADWRILCIVTSAPLALAIITPFIVPESARWLVSTGQVEKALKIMKKFEKINGTKVDPEIYQQFTESCAKLQKEEEADKSFSVLDLFKTPRLRKITILLILIWMTISLCFDGHVRNVGSLGLDLFVTFTVAAATELPADTLLTLVLDRWGRRWLACGSMCMSGLFSLLAAVVPIGAASASLAILGRFSVNIAYNIGLQYAAELLPTVVRAQGVAFIHIMGYVASILAPFVVLLATIDPSLPLVILGCLGVVGGVLSLFLPETLDKELPQTLQDGEAFGKGQRMLDFPCCNKQVEDEPTVEPTFRRRSLNRSSMRMSIRGATYRSSMIQLSGRRRHTAAI